MEPRDVPTRVAQPSRHLHDRAALQMNPDDDAPLERRQPSQQPLHRQPVEQFVNASLTSAALFGASEFKGKYRRPRAASPQMVQELAAHEQRRESFERRAMPRAVTIYSLEQTNCADLLEIGSLEPAMSETPSCAPANVPIFRNETLARNQPPAQRCTAAKSHTHTLRC